MEPKGMSELNGPVVIIPFSPKSLIVFHYLVSNGFNVACFCDKNEDLWGKKYKECEIMSTNSVSRLAEDVSFVLCDSRFYGAHQRQIHACGEYNIAYYEDLMKFEDAEQYISQVNQDELFSIAPIRRAIMNKAKADLKGAALAKCFLSKGSLFVSVIELCMKGQCKKNCGFCDDMRRTYAQSYYQKDAKSINVLTEKSDKNWGSISRILVFDHNGGGGATAYLNRNLPKLLQTNDEVYIVSFDKQNQTYLMRLFSASSEISYVFDEFRDIEILLKKLTIREVHINELVNFQGLFSATSHLKEWKDRYGYKLSFYLHDYYSICPTITLTTKEAMYCNLPPMEACEKCFEDNPALMRNECTSIEAWREHWLCLLLSCDEIIAFSESSRQILAEIYPEIPPDKYIVKPHTVDYIRRANLPTCSYGKMRIGVIGNITAIKGAHIVSETADIICNEGIDAEVIVIGTIPGVNSNGNNLFTSGIYSTKELPDLIERFDIDIVFIPSICPETFSYTTEEAIKMNVPVAVFDLGAPAERVRHYEKGIVISKIDAHTALTEIIEFLNRTKSHG